MDYVIDQQGRVAYFGTEYDPEAMVTVIDGLLGLTSSLPDIPPARGHLVRTILSSQLLSEGYNRINWDGRSNEGRELPSGLYMVRIRTLDQTAVTKLTLVR